MVIAIAISLSPNSKKLSPISCIQNTQTAINSVTSAGFLSLSVIKFILINGRELAKIIEQRIKTPEAQEEYKKRSHTVEPPFGVLKQLNTVHVTGQEEVKNRITLKAIGYNLKRLENMIKNNNEESNSLKNFANNLYRENPDIKFSFMIQ